MSSHDDRSAPRTSTAGGARPLTSRTIPPVPFDYAEVADALGEPGDDGPRVNEDLVRATSEIVRWIILGSGEQLNMNAAAKRALALAILLRVPAIEGQPTATLARDHFGCPPESLNRYVRALNRRFHLFAPGQHGRTHRRDRLDPSRN